MPRRAAPETPSQAPEIVAYLRRLLSWIAGDGSGAWMGLRVTMPQMKVLLLLRRNGATGVGLLARHLDGTTSRDG